LAESEDVHLDTETEVRLYHGWGAANLGIGAIKESVKGFRKAVDLSQRLGMIDYERSSLTSLAQTMYLWPDRVEADRILEEGITRARQIEDNALESQILSWISISEACYGSPYKAYEIVVNAGRLAMKAKDPIAINMAQVLRIWPERWLGHPAKAIELSEGVVESLGQMFDFNFLSNVVYFRGIALAEVGRIEDSIALLNHGITISKDFGPFYRHASFLNCLAYCYKELHQHEKAWHYNLRSEEMACELVETYPKGRRQYAEIAAQARVNLMENLFDEGKIDEAWDRMESLKEESRSDDYDMVRYVWESRMNYLAAQILLQRNEIGQAEVLIGENLERARTQGTKKREGGFLRLLGEVQIRRNESENAIENFNEATVILNEVGNPRQLWQAHVSLASAHDKLGRVSEARNQWGVAAEVIRNTANGLSDSELREGFLRAEPIREILSKAES